MIVAECATHPQEGIDKEILNLKYLNTRAIGWQEQSEIVSEGGGGKERVQHKNGWSWRGVLHTHRNVLIRRFQI